jgi:hypothetical protein
MQEHRKLPPVTSHMQCTMLVQRSVSTFVGRVGQPVHGKQHEDRIAYHHEGEHTIMPTCSMVTKNMNFAVNIRNMTKKC